MVALYAIGVPGMFAADLRLVEAEQAGEPRRAAILMNAGIDVNARDSRGYSALMWAAAWGSLPQIAALLERGARVNNPAADGATAFSTAVLNGHIDVVRTLVKAGANCRALDRHWDARKAARTAEMAALVDRVLTGGEYLLSAVDANDVQGVRRALAAGAPVGYVRRRDQFWEGGMTKAAGNGEIARAFREAGAHPQEFEYFRELSRRLAAAAFAGDGPQVRAALADGADPNTWVQREPLLQSAIRRGPPIVVKLLADAGAELADPALNEKLQAILKAEPEPSEPRDPVLTSILSRILVGARNLPPTPEHDRILQVVAWMAREGDHLRVSDTYREELDADARRLESSDATVFAGAVADDLLLKQNHCRALGLGMGGKVRVSFTTRQRSGVVNNWQVLYLPRIFKDAPGVAPRLIPGWTSPAVEELDPGRYLVWARDPVTRKTTERQEVPFSGKREVAMPLAIP